MPHSVLMVDVGALPEHSLHNALVVVLRGDDQNRVAVFVNSVDRHLVKRERFRSAGI